MDILGTLTITGDKETNVDGLSLGVFPCTLKFKITSQGFIRNGKLFKTLDQELLAEKLGFITWKTSLKYNIK